MPPEDNTPTPPTDPAASASTPSAPDPAPAPTPEPSAPNGAAPGWANERIDMLTKKWRTAEAEVEQLKAELQKRSAPPPPAATPPQGQTQAPPAAPSKTYTAEDVRLEALRLAQEQAFRSTVMEIDNKGAKDFPDWKQSIEGLKPLGGVSRAVVEAALETDDPARTIYEFSRDLNRASKILELPPTRQAAAVAKLAAGLGPKEAAPAVSKAPAPVSPAVNGGGSKAEASLDDPKLSTREWMELREKQLAANRGRRGRAA